MKMRFLTVLCAATLSLGAQAFPLSVVLSKSRPEFVREIAKRVLGWSVANTPADANLNELIRSPEIKDCINALESWDHAFDALNTMPNFSLEIGEMLGQAQINSLQCGKKVATESDSKWARHFLKVHFSVPIKPPQKGELFWIRYSRSSANPHRFKVSVILEDKAGSSLTPSLAHIQNSKDFQSRIRASNFISTHLLEIHSEKSSPGQALSLHSFATNLAESTLSARVVLSITPQLESSQTQYIDNSPFLMERLPLPVRVFTDRYRREFSIKPRIAVLKSGSPKDEILIP